MITSASVEIDAPADVVWRVFSDVENWPAMTGSATSLRALDGADLAVGRRYEIKQPRLPKAIWTVTAVTPGRSWTWEYVGPGNATRGIHEVTDLGDGRTLARQTVEQTGPIGATIGKVMRKLTLRYIGMEGAGLKRQAERAAHA